MNTQDFADAEIIITPTMEGTSFALAAQQIKKEYDTNLSLEYLKEYGTGGIFIETGTFRGETVRMVQDSNLYTQIYSIELNEMMYKEAHERFDDGFRTRILHNESPDAIKNILRIRHSDTSQDGLTFWLDAHASGNIPGGKYGGSPLIEELEAILEANQNLKRDFLTIFIDDKRLFGSGEWDGITEERARDILTQIDPNFTYFVLDGWQPKDIICATTMKKNG